MREIIMGVMIAAIIWLIAALIAICRVVEDLRGRVAGLEEKERNRPVTNYYSERSGIDRTAL